MTRLLTILLPALLATTSAFAGTVVVRVPEPASMALLAVGVGGIALYRRLRK